jgi:PAS domain S-box-containing protein
MERLRFGIGSQLAVAGAALSIIMVLLTGGISYILTSSLANQLIDERLQGLTSLTGQHIEEHLRHTVDDVAELAGNPVMANGLVDSSVRAAYLVPFLRGYRTSTEMAAELTLYNSQGKAIASNATGPSASPIDGARPHLVMEGWPVAQVTGDRSLSIAFPVIDPASGLPAGMLVTVVPLAPILGEAAPIFDHTLHVSLWAKDAGLLASFGQVDAVSLSATALLAVPDILKSIGLSVEVRIPATATALLRSQLTRWYGAMGLAMTIVMLVLVAVLSRRLALPLRQLSAEAARVTGDLSYRPRLLSERGDEIGQLSRTIHAMLVHLSESRRVLENRVAERTASLNEVSTRLRVILDNVIDAIVTTDTDGRIVSVNRAAERIFGWPADAMAGLEASALIAGPPPFFPDFVGRWRQLEGCRQNGSTFPLELGVSPVALADGTMFVIVFRDITVRRRLESERELLTAAIEQSPSAVVILDANCRVQFINPAFTRLSGYTGGEIYGQTLARIKSGRTPPETYDDLWATLRQGKAWQGEFINKHKDGREHTELARISPIRRADGTVTHYVAVQEDITERRALEQSLVENERFLKTIANHVPGLIKYWTRDLRCAFTNAAYEKWFGTPPRDLNGISMRAMLGDELYAANEPFVLAALAGEVQHFERSVRLHDGTMAHTWTQYVPDMVDGRVEGIFVLMTDVSELKQTQTALEDANRQLLVRTRQAEEAMQAKGEFLANMSHEIRTPINAILSFAHILERTRLTDDQKNLIHKLDRSSRFLLALIDDILTFSRTTSSDLPLERTEFHLSDIMDDVASLMAADGGAEDLELVVATAADVPDVVIGDPFRLKQVIANLVGNAIKFTKAGEVIVQVQRTGGDDTTPLLRFSVTDTGIGIPADQLSLLFEKFTQVDASTTRRYGGSGLGLAICKSVVTRMGGEIGVESTLGQGSTFHFTLALPCVVPANDPRVPLKHWLGDPLKLLIVDNHTKTREVIDAAARSFGWTTECVASGDAAVALVRNRTGADRFFDVVLMDCKMPGMDGLAACRTIQAITSSGGKGLPTMILLLSPAQAIGFPALEADLLDAVLLKPVTASSLLDTVASACGCRPVSAVNEAPPAIPAGRLTGVRILLAEDTPFSQEAEMRILHMEGAHVTLAGDGRQALYCLESAPLAFDLVLMDIHMPVMDGVEATRRMRANPELKALPVIALSAAILPQEQAAAKTAGVDDFVSKPLDPDWLIQVIRRYVAAPDMPVKGSMAGEDMEPPGFSLSIPGIDMQLASQGTDADEPLFRILANLLVDQFADVVTLVRADIGQGHLKAATGRLHAFRAATGTVGAVSITDLATTLELAITQRSDADILELLERLDLDLATLVAAIRSHLPPNQEEPGDLNPMGGGLT